MRGYSIAPAQVKPGNGVLPVKQPFASTRWRGPPNPLLTPARKIDPAISQQHSADGPAEGEWSLAVVRPVARFRKGRCEAMQSENHRGPGARRHEISASQRIAVSRGMGKPLALFFTVGSFGSAIAGCAMLDGSGSLRSVLRCNWCALDLNRRSSRTEPRNTCPRASSARLSWLPRLERKRSVRVRWRKRPEPLAMFGRGQQSGVLNRAGSVCQPRRFCPKRILDAPGATRTIFSVDRPAARPAPSPDCGHPRSY